MVKGCSQHATTVALICALLCASHTPQLRSTGQMSARPWTSKPTKTSKFECAHERLGWHYV